MEGQSHLHLNYAIFDQCNRILSFCLPHQTDSCRTWFGLNVLNLWQSMGFSPVFFCWQIPLHLHGQLFLSYRVCWWCLLLSDSLVVQRECSNCVLFSFFKPPHSRSCQLSHVTVFFKQVKNFSAHWYQYTKSVFPSAQINYNSSLARYMAQWDSQV